MTQDARSTAAQTPAAGTDAAAPRFPVLDPERLSPAQSATLQAILAGPRAGTNDPATVRRVLTGGPFNAWLRSPELGDRLQRVGAYIRYESSLPLRLNELAILVTARVWTSQFEWYAHRPLAEKAGLEPRIADELALGRRPEQMRDDEAAVYDFCTQLHRTRNVDDATFARALALFGERGVVDLVGVCGYYTAVSMTLNVARVPLPAGEPLPLAPLD